MCLICKCIADTVESLYNAVQYNMVLHTSLQDVRQNIRGCTHKRHPIPRPDGWATGRLLWIFLENWPHYNGTALYLTGQGTRIVVPSMATRWHPPLSEHLWLLRSAGSIFFYRRLDMLNEIEGRHYWHPMTEDMMSVTPLLIGYNLAWYDLTQTQNSRQLPHERGL